MRSRWRAHHMVLAELIRLGGRDGTPSPLVVAEVELVFDESRFGEFFPAKSAAKKPRR